MTEAAAIAAISLAVSFVAAMLGLGGAVLLIPAYLYLPPLVGVPTLPVTIVSGTTSAQVLVTSLLAAALHHRRGAVDRTIVTVMGVPILVSSFAGAALSGSIDGSLIVVAFAAMAILGAALLLFGRGEEPAEYSTARDFRPAAAGGLALVVGFFGGVVGAPGAFLLSPLMMTVLRIPTRIVIGSTLGIVLIAAASTTAGKLLAGQIDWTLVAAAAAGAVPGALAGTAASHRLEVRSLRRMLAMLVAAVAATMLLQTAGLLPGS